MAAHAERLRQEDCQVQLAMGNSVTWSDFASVNKKG